MTSEPTSSQQPGRRTRHNASTITDPELDLLYSEIDRYHRLLGALGLPPGVVPISPAVGPARARQVGGEVV